MNYLEQATVNPAIVKAQRNFFMAVLDEAHLESIETALALEEIADQIKQNLAEKWEADQQH